MIPGLGDAVDATLRVRQARIAHKNHWAALAELKAEQAAAVRAVAAQSPSLSPEEIADALAAELVDVGVSLSERLGVSHDSVRRILSGDVG